MPNGNGEFDLPQTQTYYAKSVLNDGQSWFNVITLLSLAITMPEITGMIPPAYQLPVTKVVTAIVALGNLYLRVFHVRRPVAFIASGDAKPVEVKTLTPNKKSGDC